MQLQATVSLPYSELQMLQETTKKAEEKVAELQQQLTQAKVEASDPILLKLARDAIAIVRFAVSQLPAESTKGWPHEALLAVAEALPQLPDATTDDVELSVTLASFSRECKMYEQRRAVMTGSVGI